MTDRPEPCLTRWRELVIPPEDLAEVAAWLADLCDRRSGRVPPGQVPQQRVTARLAAYADLARRGAREVAAARAAARAVPTPAPPPVVAPAQPAASSEAEEVTTAEAAAITGLSAEWMRQLAASGRVRARRTSRRVWLLGRADVIAMTTDGSTDGTRSGTGPCAA